MPDTPTPSPVETESSNLTSLIPPVAPDENVSVSAPEPQQVQPVSSPQLTDTIPSETAPNNPDIERQYHEAWWRHALGKVADSMTDNETWHIRRDPKTGEVSATRDPSTLGEKWGRIAATALGGAAAGLANAQGPGGEARAAAAGTQFGLQQPQKRMDQAEHQVDYGNKQLLAKANRIHLTQQTYLMAQQAKLADLKFDQESMDAMNRRFQMLADSPNAEVVGEVDPSDPNSVIRLIQKDPDAKDAFLGKNNKVLRVVPGKDHKLQLVKTDRSWEEQRNSEPMDILYEGKDANGKPTLLSKTVPPNGDKVVNIQNHNDAITTKHYTNLKSWADAQKAEHDAEKPPPQPKTLLEMNLAIAQETDPAKKAALIEARDTTVAQDRQLKEKPASEGTWGLAEDKDGNSVLWNSKTGHTMDAPENINKAGTKAKQDAAIEKATKPARDAMEYANLYMDQGTKNPKTFTGPGDEALMDKYFELAKPSSGFRMSGPQQSMLINARSWMGSLRGRAYHEIHGTWFDPKQRKEIVDTMGNLAVSSGVPPSGGGGGPQPQPQIPAGRFPVYVKGQLVGHSADKAGTDYQALAPATGGQ